VIYRLYVLAHYLAAVWINSINLFTIIMNN